MGELVPIRRHVVRVGLGMLAAALLGPLAATPAAGMPEPIAVEVLQVVDGDSLVVLDPTGRRLDVRLHGIDAPERGQPFADVSRRHLRDTLRGRSVHLLPAGTDRFGRLVATVLADDTDAGEAQIGAGLAWVFRRFAGSLPQHRRTAYEAAEAEARTERRGLWGDRAPLAPWDYRAAQRAGTAR